jgi:hypothetical protein
MPEWRNGQMRIAFVGFRAKARKFSETLVKKIRGPKRDITREVTGSK